MCYAGLAPKSLLKVRLRCKACHAEERAAFRFRSTAKSIAPRKLHLQKKLHGGLRCAKWGWHIRQPPQNQLQLAECTCKKKAAWWVAR